MGKQSTRSRFDRNTDEAFAEIVRIAEEASGEAGPEQYPGIGSGGYEQVGIGEIGCFIKALPPRLSQKAALLAARTNPANAPLLENLPAGVIEPARATVLTAKYWGPMPRQFTVSFMDSPPPDLRARIVSHLNEWGQTANKTFVETAGTGEIRISRGGGGYWSYLGTDVLLIPPSRQTMNLQGFTMNTPESEFRRVIPHEAGHTLGFPHEHMRRELVGRIDPQKAYAYFLANQGWSKEMVDQQVLTPLEDSSIFGTPPDQDSIMCYRLPGSITRDGRPIRGGATVNPTDLAFAGLIYPKVFPNGGQDLSSRLGGGRLAEDDWDPAEDVPLPI